MTAFWPWIGKHHKCPSQASISHIWQNKAHIIIKQPDIWNVIRLDMAQQASHAIDKGFSPNKASIRTVFGKASNMLTAAKANFKKDICGRMIKLIGQRNTRL